MWRGLGVIFDLAAAISRPCGKINSCWSCQFGPGGLGLSKGADSGLYRM